MTYRDLIRHLRQIRGIRGTRTIGLAVLALGCASNGAPATTDGHYAQTVRLRDSTTVSVAGTFRALWHLDTDGVWRISSMHTASLPKP